MTTEKSDYSELFIFSPYAHGLSRHARDFIERKKLRSHESYARFKSDVRNLILEPNLSFGDKAEEYLDTPMSDSFEDDIKMSEAERYFRDIWNIVAPDEVFPLDESGESNSNT